MNLLVLHGDTVLGWCTQEDLDFHYEHHPWEKQYPFVREGGPIVYAEIGEDTEGPKVHPTVLWQRLQLCATIADLKERP